MAKSKTLWNPFKKDAAEARAEAEAGSAESAGDWALMTSIDRAKAAGKPPTEAEIRQLADPAATQAGMVAQAAGGEAAQLGLGLGGGPIQAGRGRALATQLGFDPNAGSKAILDARQLTNQIKMQQYESAMDRVQSQSQFDVAQGKSMWSKLFPVMAAVGAAIGESE